MVIIGKIFKWLALALVIFSACQNRLNNVMINQNNNSINKEKRMQEKQELPLMKFTPDDYKKIYDGGGDYTKDFPLETLGFLHNEMGAWMPKLVQYRIKNKKDLKRSDLRLPIVIRVTADSVNSFDINVNMVNLKTKEV